MNVYDEAHSLARAIKESEEYKRYESAKTAVNANAELAAMIKDFQNKQFEMQAKQMMGKEVAADLTETIQNLYGVMMRDPLAADYMQCEMRFQMMMSDVYKILGEAMGIEQPQ